MHYKAIVILPKDTDHKDQCAVQAAISAILEPYNEHTEVETYKERFQSGEIEAMVRYYTEDHPGEPVPPLVTLAERWHGRPAGEDEEGLYTLTTYNPKSKWDWWRIGGRYEGKWDTNADRFDDNIRIAHELPHGWTCRTLVTPNGDWYDKERFVPGEQWADVGSFVETPNWDGLRMEIMSAFPDHPVVIVDYHI